MPESPKRLRVGIIGAGEVAQVIHLPTLSLLSHLYTTTAICDISQKNAEHCAAKFHIPLSTTNPAHLFSSPNVDIIFILTSDEFHEPYTISALQAGKHVMLEKPLTLSLPSAERILAAATTAAETARAAAAESSTPKLPPIVFLGYMRRYAHSFTQTFQREIESIPRILYARVRDFSGPNATFVRQSGTFPVKHASSLSSSSSDVPVAAAEESTTRLDALYREAFPDQARTEARVKFWRFLGSLGSHDISLMREILGFPERVVAVTAHEPFYSAIFDYRNSRTPAREPFSVTYESGIDGVSDFDAHFAVYGETKRVRIQYDSPYVKGLAIKVTVQETNPHGEIETREILGSYEDAYTAELRELYECVVHGKEVKTSVQDAMQDLRLFDLMYRKWDQAQHQHQHQHQKDVVEQS